MNNPLIILQINVISKHGSTGRIMEDIGLLSDKEGYNCLIAYSRKDNKSALKSIKIGNTFDYFLHGLHTRFFDRHGLGSLIETKKFIKKIQVIKPDIIHLHNIHGYFLNYKIFFHFLKKNKIPVVWTMHDCWPFTGHCAYFDFAKCSRWQTGCYDCPQIRKYPASLFVDNSKSNYIQKKTYLNLPKNITIVPVSNWLDKLLEKSFLNNYPRKVIHNGIDLSIFTYTDSDFRVKNDLINKTIILGVSAIWDERKGLNDFVKLSERLEKNYVIVLIGINAKQIKQLPKSIITIERTDSKTKLAQIYSAADIFFNPTWEDNYPTTNLEAIACGTPVITYNTGGCKESITKKTGFIINKGDIFECINKIKSISLSDKLQYRKNCINYAKRYFDKDSCFKEYIHLYSELIK